SPGKRSATGGAIRHTAKNPAPSGTGFFLFDAWQFMAGVLPATLRAVAAQRSNPLPADLSLLRRALIDKQQIKQKAQSFD
ncbi:hypothetical protein, partial [Klebsiella aerogenes]|uniref:hypothetical protein n=1 Tax=Klebsiella aerogenes TaxID=548 RepID=UPI001952A637